MHRDYQKRYYAENRDLYIQQARESYRHLYAVLQRLKTLVGCANCGYRASSAALQFHHRNPANKNGVISAHIRRGRKALKVELAKCIVLCANCHAIEHYEQT